MTKKLLKKSLLLFLFGIIIVSCTLEKDALEEHEHKELIKQRISLYEIPGLQSKINARIQTNKSMNRGGEIDYLELINPDNVLLIEEENGNKHYTFSLNMQENNTLTNVVIKQVGTEIDYKVIEYASPDIEQWLIDNIDNGYSNITPTVTTKGTDNCYEFDYRCPSPLHHQLGDTSCNIDESEYVLTMTIVPCGGGGGNPDGDGGGEGSGNFDHFGDDNSNNNTGSPSDNNYGSGGNNNNTTFTNPNPPCDPRVDCPLFDQDPKNPCTKIKKLQDDTNFKGRMANLIDAARGWSFERCYVMYNAPTPTTTNNYTYQTFDGTISSPASGYTGDTTMQGIIHSHYNGLVSIFSAGDLQDLYFKLKNYPEITDDFFMGVVTSSNTAYLLQVPDRATFIAFGDKYLANDEKIDYFMKDIMLGKYNIMPDSSNAVNELGFLKMMADLNMGVSLASVDFNASTPSAGAVFNTWTKKEYNKRTRTVNPSNCN